MNIFILDKSPEKAAVFHVDVHVNKMILESAQIMCSVHWLSGGSAPYKLTHKHHPCILWAGESMQNYFWLRRLAVALYEEKIHRTGKGHKSWGVICNLPSPNLPNIGLTPFALAMDDEYKQEDAVQSYRTYYMEEKNELWGYTNRNPPHWWK